MIGQENVTEGDAPRAAERVSIIRKFWEIVPEVEAEAEAWQMLLDAYGGKADKSQLRRAENNTLLSAYVGGKQELFCYYLQRPGDKELLNFNMQLVKAPIVYAHTRHEGERAETALYLFLGADRLPIYAKQTEDYSKLPILLPVANVLPKPTLDVRPEELKDKDTLLQVTSYYREPDVTEGREQLDATLYRELPKDKRHALLFRYEARTVEEVLAEAEEADGCTDYILEYPERLLSSITGKQYTKEADFWKDMVKTFGKEAEQYKETLLFKFRFDKVDTVLLYLIYSLMYTEDYSEVLRREQQALNLFDCKQQDLEILLKGLTFAEFAAYHYLAPFLKLNFFFASGFTEERLRSYLGVPAEAWSKICKADPFCDMII